MIRNRKFNFCNFPSNILIIPKPRLTALLEAAMSLSGKRNLLYCDNNQKVIHSTRNELEKGVNEEKEKEIN